MKNLVIGSLKQRLLATSVAALLAPAAIAAPLYSITDLGDLPGGADQSIAMAINNNGWVAGYSSAATGYHAFVWDSTNGMTDLGDLPGGADFSIAYAINDSGQVVGRGEAATGTRAFRWDSDVMTDLGDLPGGSNYSEAHGINDSGQVVGWSSAERSSGSFFYSTYAFLWQGDMMTDIAEPPGTNNDSYAYAINDSGQIVGRSGGLAFLWDSINGMTNLGYLSGGSSSSALGINESGQVVGWSSAEIGEHAVLWDSSRMTDLGTLPGYDYSHANAINESGQVVGITGDRAFVWDSVNGMIDLNDLLAEPVGWDLSEATAINDAGQIVGWGTNGRAYLLTPIIDTPPPPPPPSEGAGTTEDPFVPSEDSTPETFDFVVTVTEEALDTPIFIDPIIAIGYDYIVNSGPNVASVLLPNIGDGVYQIYLWDGGAFSLLAGEALAGAPFDFSAGGVDRFRVLGIEIAAALDPANPLAFITGLTFVSAGDLNISQIPVTFDTDPPSPAGVPEPMTLSLLGAGLVGLGAVRRKRC